MRSFPPVRHVILVVVLSGACAPPTLAPSPHGVGADVAYLASRQLAGRGAGSRGGDSAAAYIVREYQRLGLPGPYPANCGAATSCPAAYLQHFDLGGDTAQNVVAVVTGTDPSLRREYIVVGAHYDHLGESPFYSRDPELGTVVRPGADDNASGSAALLELARRLAARPSGRSVLLVHFDAEELGLIGSRRFLRSPPVPIAAMVLMLNLDMVGRLRSAPLQVESAGASREWRALVDGAAMRAGVKTAGSFGGGGRSDHASFARAGVPAVMLTTGLHDDYHSRSDVASRVDAAGILRIVDVAEGVIRLADERVPAAAEAP
jgi:hypothetical protein